MKSYKHFLTVLLVVHVGLSSLGGHIDNDTDLTLVFIQLDLNVMLIVS